MSNAIWQKRDPKALDKANINGDGLFMLSNLKSWDDDKSYCCGEKVEAI